MDHKRADSLGRIRLKGFWLPVSFFSAATDRVTPPMTATHEAPVPLREACGVLSTHRHRRRAASLTTRRHRTARQGRRRDRHGPKSPGGPGAQNTVVDHGEQVGIARLQGSRATRRMPGSSPSRLVRDYEHHAASAEYPVTGR